MSDVSHEERPTGAAPLHKTRYRGITLPAAWATRVAEREARDGEAPSGPLLHLLMRARGVQRAHLPTDETALTLWLRAAQQATTGDGQEGYDLVVGGPPEAVGERGLWVGDVEQRPDGGAWRGVPLPDGLWLAGRGDRAPRWRESEVERFVALLLAVMEPPTLHLGPDVIFDASAKPLATRVQFSGAGGTVGAGELLLAHPDGTQRFTPQPGAVALLLAEPLTPPRSDFATLTLGDATLVLIVV